MLWGLGLLLLPGVTDVVPTCLRAQTPADGSDHILHDSLLITSQEIGS